VAERIRIARIGAAHGVRGEVRLWPYTQDPQAVVSYGPLETADGTREVIVEHLRPGKDHWVARLTGVTTREAAQALTNVDLFVPRERLPPIEETDTFYHADLVGLTAVTTEGAVLGTVTAVHNFGAGDIIEITSESGTPLMLSFTDAAVPKVDLKAKRIVVVPPPETGA